MAKQPKRKSLDKEGKSGSEVIGAFVVIAVIEIVLVNMILGDGIGCIG